jgi:hypothetical protein
MKKLALVIVLAVTGGALWIEHGHRVVIDAPAAAELQAPTAAAACPENDTLPYDSRCLEFLNVPTEVAPRVRVAVRAKQDVQPEPCPDSDKVPYSASCIAFLKGVGRNWQGPEPPASIPAPQ